MKRASTAKRKECAKILASKSLKVRTVLRQELLVEWSKFQEPKDLEALIEKDVSLGTEFPFLRHYASYVYHFAQNEKATKAVTKEQLFRFADVYAQLIGYGLWSIRWLSQNSETDFLIENLRVLLPKTSVFLNDMFVDLLEVDSSLPFRTCVQDIFVFFGKSCSTGWI